MKELNRILRCPDEAVSADPLDTNVNDVNTDYPLLPASYYQFRLEGRKETNKAQTGDNLIVVHKLVEAAQDTKGEPVPPGMEIKSYISLVTTNGGTDPATGKVKQPYTNDSIKKSIARVAKAAGINATVRQIIDNPAIIDGKVVRAQVKINPETSEFSASNSIKGYATE